MISGSIISGLVAYPAVFSLGSFLAAASGVSLFAIGALLARGTSNRAGRAKRGFPRAIPAWLNIVIVGATLLYALLALLSAFPLLLAGDLAPENWSELRDEHLARQATQSGSLTAYVATWAQAGALAVAIGAPIFLRHNRGLLLLSALSWSALLIQSAQVAGRFLLGAAIAMVAYCWLLSRSPSGKQPSLRQPLSRLSARHRVLLAGSLLLVCYFTFVVFPPLRDPGLVGNEVEKLKEGHDRDFGPLTWFLHDALGWEGALTAAYGLSYLTEPLPKLTFYLETTDMENWYMLGSYSAPIFPHTLSSFTGERSSWHEARDKIAELSAPYLSTNPWSTGLRDLIIDFGLVGAPLVMFGMGYVSQRIYAASVRSPTAINQIRASLVAVSAAILPFLSPLLTLVIFYGIILMTTAAAVEKRAPPRPVRRSANVP